MKLLPTTNIVYKTKLPFEEVIRRLYEITEPVKSLRPVLYNPRTSKRFKGQIKGQEFIISRIIYYRNSLTPIIKGTIEKDTVGVTIKVKMSIHSYCVPFLIFGFSIFVSLTLLMLIHMLSSVDSMMKGLRNPDDYSFAFGTLVMLMLFYRLVWRSFEYESVFAKNYLQVLFEADMIEE